MRRSEVHAAQAVSYIQKALMELQDIWEDIGILEDDRMERTNVAHEHITSLLNGMIAQEKALKNKLIASIASCRTELTELCDELQLPPFEEEAGRTMLQMEKDFRTRVAIMRKHRVQRMEDLQALVSKDGELCDLMCTSPFVINQTTVPSLEQLEIYSSYIVNLTKEKERRYDEFLAMKEQIAMRMDDIERVPENSFEKDVMSEDVEAFCLSSDNLASLKLLLTLLDERKAENERCCAGYRTEIQELWGRLEIPQEARDALSEHMIKSKKRNMKALQAEVKRLTVLKMKSIERFVLAVRAEIAQLWEKCFYSEAQRRAFAPYYDEDFTEELLSLHEAELRTLKTCLEHHRELFEGITKWRENWTLFLELEQKANDPSRLNNRGGNLLKEQKQRTDLQRSLPKLEKSLKAQIDLWEQENAAEFLVNGQKFLEYVQQQWAVFHRDKEREKLERQMKKTKRAEEEMLYGTAGRTPSKRRMATTPSKVRKMNSAPALSVVNSTMGGQFSQTMVNKPLPAKKGLGLQIPVQGKPPQSLIRNKENVPLSAKSKSQDSQDSAFSLSAVAGSYSEFARELSKASLDSLPLNSTVSQ